MRSARCARGTALGFHVNGPKHFTLSLLSPTSHITNVVLWQ